MSSITMSLSTQNFTQKGQGCIMKLRLTLQKGDKQTAQISGTNVDKINYENIEDNMDTNEDGDRNDWGPPAGQQDFPLMKLLQTSREQTWKNNRKTASKNKLQHHQMKLRKSKLLTERTQMPTQLVRKFHKPQN